MKPKKPKKKLFCERNEDMRWE